MLIRRIYEMIPSQMENKKKRVVAQDIRGKKGDRFDQYKEEFESLISSGISLSVHAISNPHFPLSESLQKKNPDYHILSSTVISNERKVHQDGNITYLPIYFVMFMENDTPKNDASEYIF